MESTSILLSALVFSPLLVLVFIAFVPNKESNTIRLLGFLGSLPAFILSSWIFWQYHQGFDLTSVFENRNWIRFGFYPEEENRPFTVNYELGLNGFSLLMIWLTSLLTMVAAVASLQIKERVKNYFIWFFLLEIGMLGVFASENLILFFLFFELTLVSLFFLIGKWGGFEKEKAAFQYLLYNGFGSGILLIVIAFLFAKTGTVQINELTTFLNRGDIPISDTEKLWLMIALLISFGVKIPIFPFHTWMLKVHVQAPPAIVILHSGILLKIGAYGIIRFGLGFFPNEFEKLSLLLLILGLINLLYGAFLAFIQDELKLVLAYSSVSHMGIVLLGLGALNEAGLEGAIFQVISHGFISALLFYIVNIIQNRHQTTNIQKLGGMSSYMPKTSGLLLVVALASLGLPSMSGFISEFMAFTGVFKENVMIGVIGTLGLILTAAYILRAVLSIIFGSPKSDIKREDMNWFEITPAFVLVFFIILIGVYPNFLSNPLKMVLLTLLKGIGG